MVKNSAMLYKTLVIGIILLFIGVSFFPKISGDIVKNNENGHISDTDTSSSSNIDWWPMFHHDPSHSGNSTSTAPDANTLRWSSEIGRIEYSSPAVVNDRVYIGSRNGKVHCLDANTGGKIWNYSTGNIVWSSPAVVNGRVYVGSFTGGLYCLNATTGSKIWCFFAYDSISSSPTVAEGRIYFSSYDSNVYCINAETGDYIWSFTTDFGIMSSPAVADGKVYVNSCDFILYCLDAYTGDEIWNYYAGCYASSPAFAYGNVYISAAYSDDNLCCLDAETGEKIWGYDTNQIFDSSPAISDGKVYFGDIGKKVYCLNAYDGSFIWSYKTNGAVESSPAVADRKVYVGCHDYFVYCLDADTGNKIWTYETDNSVWSSPAVADGRVYIGSRDGKVYCFEDESENQPPEAPKIEGPIYGKAGVTYTYNFTTTDPNGDIIWYYVDWDDGSVTPWFGPFPSGVTRNASHAWSKGNWTIKAKAKDIFGKESDWSTLKVNIPRNKIATTIHILRFLKRRPNLIPIIRQLLGQ